ncbi:MHS family MFS transporter, partial [Acinetobacter baumannii]
VQLAGVLCGGLAPMIATKLLSIGQGNPYLIMFYIGRALLHKDLKVKTSHIYSNLSDNSGMWSA